MDTEAISKEIVEIRGRLADIDDRLAALPDDDTDGRESLEAERDDLRERLRLLQDALAKGDGGRDTVPAREEALGGKPEIPPM